MTLLEGAYTAALHGAAPLLPLFALGEGKLARGIRGRRGVLARMAAWAAAHPPDPARPLVWFHAPSVGEGLQARAVLEAFRAEAPHARVAYTFFSPSAEAFARTVAADFADYLPLDLPEQARRALELLDPAVLAFSKADVWPNLTREAARRGTRLCLLSATLPAGSSRLRGLARALLTPAYARLDRVAAISAADAEQFAALGVPPERRSVMGDARFDQVWRRAAAVDRSAPLLARLAASPGTVTLVAGSTWPADEARLLEAVRRCRADGVSLRLLLVPHEPTPSHLSRAEAALDALGLRHLRLGRVEAQGDSVAEVVLIDRVGILGDLYALADVAYVGGGFGAAGLHSVLEPAAFGAPVLFGPRHGNAREAADLIAQGGAWAVGDADALARTLLRLSTDTAVRRHAGAAARRYVEAGLGAAARGARIVAELLAAGRSTAPAP